MDSNVFPIITAIGSLVLSLFGRVSLKGARLKTEEGGGAFALIVDLGKDYLFGIIR